MDSNKKDKSNKLTKVLLLIYLIVLVWILLFKLGVQFSYMANRSVNLIPFGEFFLAGAKVDKAELILNMVIFMPLGVYTAVLFKQWTWARKVFFFFMISLFLEAVQFIFRIGAFDITDIITNTLGGIAGLLLLIIIEKLFNNNVKAQRFINVIAATGTLIMIVLLVLLKLQMLPVRYQ